MGESNGFGLHVDFARRELVRSLHLAPSGLGGLQMLQPLPREIGRGSVELTTLGSGIGYGRYCCEDVTEEVHSRMELRADQVKFTFHLSSEPGEVGIEGLRNPIVLSRSDSYILGPSVIGTQTVRPGMVSRELSLFADSTVVDSCFADQGESLPRSLKQCLTHPASEPYFFPGRATAAMGQALRQMLTCGLRGGIARLYLEAKVLEIIALRLAQLGNGECRRRRLTLMLRDVELLEEARHILLNRCQDPPSISELAACVGLNRTKLKAGFKELFGTTVFGFVRSQRLDKALELLRDGACNVTEAAQSVGYSSLSAFSLAFQAEFGFTPGSIRGWYSGGGTGPEGRRQTAGTRRGGARRPGPLR